MGPCARASSTIAAGSGRTATRRARAEAVPRGGSRQPARASRARVQPPALRGDPPRPASRSAAGASGRRSGARSSRIDQPRDDAGQGARLLQHRSLSSARTARRQSSSGVRATAVARRLLPGVSGEHPGRGGEAPGGRADPAGGCARQAWRGAGTRRFHGPRRGGRRDAQDPEPGRPAHWPSRRASAPGASELMMRASRPRVTKLNAQLMSTSRRFWKPTR